MQDIVLFFVALGLFVFNVFAALAYSDAVQLLLEKNQNCVRYFARWIGYLFFQTAVFSWLPGRINADFSLMDGALVFEDGALVRNLGSILLVQAFSIGTVAAKYLWRVIRKQETFSGKFLFLEILIAGVLVYFGVRCEQSEYVMHFEGGETLGKIVMIALAVLGGYALYSGIRTDRAEKKKGDDPKTTGQPAAPKPTGQTAPKPAGQTAPKPAGQTAAPRTPSHDTIVRFNQIVAEKDRLSKAGDYASQIPLLIEASGLNLDDDRKRRIWNYMGIAYRNIDCGDKAAACFHNALRLGPDDPSSNNNLAMSYMDKQEYDTALLYVEKAVAKAKERKAALGLYYANYALIVGLNGDKQKATQYLLLAQDEGCRENEIAFVQNRLGIRF